MLEILEFIFSSFWIFIGTVMLMSVFAGIVSVFKPYTVIKVYKTAEEQNKIIDNEI